MHKRAIVIVLDSVGIGAEPDADEFGDSGAHTLGNINRVRPLKIPNLIKLGLGNIEDSRLERAEKPIGSFGRAREVTRAKDTTSGHWEMAGVIMEPPFRTYPDGFPQRMIEEFERCTGRGTLGNEVASGTEIIVRLGDEHVKTGKLIVYTSADSVFQIAAHEDVVPLEELYRDSMIAREMLTGDDLVGRVIARPFIGANGKYTRTENRRDFAVAPTGTTVLDALAKEGYQNISIGKIEDIFDKRNVGLADHTKNNHDGIEATLKYTREGAGDFIFTNLVDFDMLYGHRNNVEGYAKALEYFDEKLPEIMDALDKEDLLIMTADHGCDPTWRGTDHTREYIPVVCYSPSLSGGSDIGTRKTFADIGATVYEYVTGKRFGVGESFLSELA